MIPPRALVKRIGDIHATIRRYPHVVRAVEIFALIVFDEHGCFFIGGNGPQLVFPVGAGNQVALPIEIHAVGATGGSQERGELAIHVPFHDAIIRLVGKKDVAIGVARRTFGELKMSGQLFEFRTRRDDAARGRERR